MLSPVSLAQEAAACHVHFATLLPEWIGEHPEWSRKRLARELCARWGWRDARGRLQDFAARSFLMKLEAQGRLAVVVHLPDAVKRNPPHLVRLVQHFKGVALVFGKCDLLQRYPVDNPLAPVEVAERVQGLSLSDRPEPGVAPGFLFNADFTRSPWVLITPPPSVAASSLG